MHDATDREELKMGTKPIELVHGRTAVRYEVRDEQSAILLDVTEYVQDAYAYVDLHGFGGHVRVWAVLDDGSEMRLPA